MSFGWILVDWPADTEANGEGGRREMGRAVTVSLIRFHGLQVGFTVLSLLPIIAWCRLPDHTRLDLRSSLNQEGSFLDYYRTFQGSYRRRDPKSRRWKQPASSPLSPHVNSVHMLDGAKQAGMTSLASRILVGSCCFSHAASSRFSASVSPGQSRLSCHQSRQGRRMRLGSNYDQDHCAIRHPV